MNYPLKCIILFCFVLTIHNVYPNIDSLKKVLATKDFKEVQRYLYEFRKTPNNYSSVTHNYNIVDSYFTVSLQFQKVYKSDSISKLSAHLYVVKILRNQRDIIYYTLFDNGIIKIAKDAIPFKTASQISYLDSIAYDDFKHNCRHIDKEISNFIFSNWSFPFYCYGRCYSCKPTFERLLMDEFIKTRDSNAMYSWLFSTSLTLRVYAIEGLYKLEKSGMVLSDLQWQTVQYLNRCKTNLRVIHNCEHSYKSVRGLSRKYKLIKRIKS